MIVAIHQPDYIPYPGYFYKIANSDCFIFLDDAQYSNAGFTNCNRIKTPQGELRLKIPVLQTLGDTIMEVVTKDELGWKKKHLKTLLLNYKKAKYFDEIYYDFEKLLMNKFDNIADMNIALIQQICKGLGIGKRFERSSSYRIQSARENRVIDLCKAVGASTYLSGIGARVYQKEEHFAGKDMKLTYSDYQPIVYPQLWGEFIPNLSILDYLFHQGYDCEGLKIYS
ncbi:WbqC family protein [Mobilitalea sibirica]|uniref:WbqC family protein n=1 Tax=Mobilitalea sibirica TaxID=1462919 RepID=A0A8J7KRL3_9FIRM|nr:WbqC family protein [Mobilitalea sibirica]MBH1939411.1 WbqC family protein [Mobilitalea sibirica]